MVVAVNQKIGEVAMQRSTVASGVSH